ncbi:hypothetical protein [uncultured Desulfosarcina sp.]|uniref:hypothetical protein n=1 Tax=uncultured Desulfosarcina sp. TaxID=218289 RepID=UPI0029C80C85|nr:hypothetical protein [uncultured Desulfosarcina sp.]
MIASSNQILIGKQAIIDYLQMSENTIMKFVRRGLPVRIIDNRYYAHTDNLDRYFQDLTLGNRREGKKS